MSFVDEPREQSRKRFIDTSDGFLLIASPPGAIESQDCPVCGQKMTVRRDVRVSRGLVAGISGRSVRHDEFRCDNSTHAWHVNARALQQEADTTASSRVRALIKADWHEVIQANRSDLAEVSAHGKEESNENL